MTHYKLLIQVYGRIPGTRITDSYVDARPEPLLVHLTENLATMIDPRACGFVLFKPAQMGKRSELPLLIRTLP